jgi:hypothetical protein
MHLSMKLHSSGDNFFAILSRTFGPSAALTSRGGLSAIGHDQLRGATPTSPHFSRRPSPERGSLKAGSFQTPNMAITKLPKDKTRFGSLDVFDCFSSLIGPTYCDPCSCLRTDPHVGLIMSFPELSGACREAGVQVQGRLSTRTLLSRTMSFYREVMASKRKESTARGKAWPERRVKPSSGHRLLPWPILRSPFSFDLPLS